MRRSYSALSIGNSSGTTPTTFFSVRDLKWYSINANRWVPCLWGLLSNHVIVSEFRGLGTPGKAQSLAGRGGIRSLHKWIDRMPWLKPAKMHPGVSVSTSSPLQAAKIPSLEVCRCFMSGSDKWSLQASRQAFRPIRILLWTDFDESTTGMAG